MGRTNLPIDSAAATHRVKVVKPIAPKRVRYIKLGKGGDWEKECLERGAIRFGFGTGSPERSPLCRARRWDELTKVFVDAGRAEGTATRFTNEARIFFEADASTLWITFIGGRLWWGWLEGPAESHQERDSVWRKVAGGWRSTDLTGEALTKLDAFRGTSCDLDVAVYLVRRINGQKRPEVERAVAAIEELRLSALGLMRHLGPRDFETLVHLVFTTSGWRRQGAVGRTQKTLDLDLILPSTGERAFVQVKSKTTSAELEEYVAQLDAYPHDRMFYVYHSGEASTDDERVKVIGPEKLAELVVDAALVEWVMRKVL
jgi:hypothetical protein